MTRINTNISSLVAQNRLGKTNADLQTALTRLSTGLRINTGKDDPAGLIASESLRSDITSINKAITNTQRAAQIIATADSALGQVSSLLNDIRGLVVEASNRGAISDDEIAANQLQIDSTLEAINRIAQNTTFQGRKLLDGSLEFVTTSGTNFANLTDLRINQANLGVAGSVAMDVSITTAATRARIEVPSIPAAGDPGQGTITLQNKTRGAEATTANLTTAAGGEFTVSAKDAGDYDGSAGNSLKVSVIAGTTTPTARAVTAVQTAGTGPVGDYTIGIKPTSTRFAGSLGNAVTADIIAGNTATAQAVSDPQEVNGVAAAFTVRAKAGGTYDGAAGNVIDVVVQSGAGSTGAALSGNTLTITVNNGSSLSLATIKAALLGDPDFNPFDLVIAEGSENLLFRKDGSDDIAAFDLNGATSGTDADATASFNSSTNKITILVNRNQNTSLAAVKAAIEADTDFTSDFEFNLGTDATYRSTGSLDNRTSVAFAGGSNALAEYSKVGDLLTILVSNSSATQTLANVKLTLDAIPEFSSDFNFTIGTAGNFATNGSDDISESAFTGGTDTSTGDDVLSITSPSGAIRNGTITINRSATVTTPTATVDEDGNITLLVSSTATTTLNQIKSAIETLTGYSATLGTSAGDSVYDPAIDTFNIANISGATDGGLNHDIVFELSSLVGSHVFQISATTTLSQLIAQINLVSDATGVQASADADTLVLESVDYGSQSTVDFRIISEDAAGVFTTGVGIRSRDSGTDAVARINGVDASSIGNSLKVSNSVLDVSMTVEAGFEGTISFSITGGGAKFQLGPEVVANQQARIGIGSLNTARLGGASGKLYQMAEGGVAALANDPTLASQILDEAINQVTSLRGRLGAFQATTLESNLVSLHDTVVNLQEAESTIRDADFAAETAALTRAQILVQSGTAVLTIANQNPENVLRLLQ